MSDKREQTTIRLSVLLGAVCFIFFCLTARDCSLNNWNTGLRVGETEGYAKGHADGLEDCRRNERPSEAR